MLKSAGPVLLLLLAAVIFAGCQKAAQDAPAASAAPPPEASVSGTGPTADATEPANLPTAASIPDEYGSRGQLMATVDSQEDAQRLADLYGITLVDFRYRIAVFRTDENPRDVIRRGEEQGWPPLSLNHTGSLA